MVVRLKTPCTQLDNNRTYGTLSANGSGSILKPTRVDHTACFNVGCHYCDLFGPNMEALAEELGMSPIHPPAKRARSHIHNDQVCIHAELRSEATDPCAVDEGLAISQVVIRAE